jgi:hypothetical protein
MRYRLMATYRGVPYEVGLGPSNSEVVLFAACPPPEELGFEPATGHWRKQVIRAEIDALWESRPVGTFRGEPCIVLDDPGERLHIAYLGTDADRAANLGYWQVDRGVFELLTQREEVAGLTEERVDRPLLWGEQTDETGPVATYPYGKAPWPVATLPIPTPQPPLDAAFQAETSPAVDAPLADPPLASAPLADPPLASAPLADPPLASAPLADPPLASALLADGRPETVTSPAVPAPAPAADDAQPSAGTWPADVNGGMDPYPGHIPADADSGPLPAFPGDTDSGPLPAFPGDTDSGPLPAFPGDTDSGPLPAFPADTDSGPLPAFPGDTDSGPLPAFPADTDSGPLPVPPGFYDPENAALAGITPASNIGGRAARRQRVPTREIFCELADLASIPRAAYALETETDGAMCLLATPEGFEVFIAADGARHELRSFAEEEAAYFYLFGVLAAEAIRSGALAPTIAVAHPYGGTV